MNKFINFQAVLFFKYFDKNLDRYPKKKKNNREANEAPKPK